MTEYWFARYRLDPRRGRGVVPITWQGRAVIAGFVGAMVGGGVLFLLIALLTPYYALGIVVFVFCAFGGGCTFIWAAVTKSDPEHTVDDYRTARPD